MDDQRVRSKTSTCPRVCSMSWVGDLSRLSPEANQALAVAALCGLEFGVRVLCGVPDAGTPDAVVDGLDEAVHARLLVETGPGRFAFTHAIVRDALTRELTMAKRARLHRALGEAIVAVYGDAPDVPLAELARHFTEAAVLGDTAAAARWATAAARAAADQADHRGAVAVLERALGAIEAVEPARPGRPVRRRRRAGRTPLRPRWDRTPRSSRRSMPLASCGPVIGCSASPCRASMRRRSGCARKRCSSSSPEAAPIRALAVASLAWLKIVAVHPRLHRRPRHRDRTARRHPSGRTQGRCGGPLADRVRRRWASRAQPTGSACATRPSRSTPRPRIRGGTRSRPAWNHHR